MTPSSFEALGLAEPRPCALTGQQFNRPPPVQAAAIPALLAARGLLGIALTSPRGIDVSGIPHVINYDLPVEPESHVHRIGRTVPAASGTAISFFYTAEHAALRASERCDIATILAGGDIPPEHTRSVHVAATPGRSQRRRWRRSRMLAAS